MKSTTLTPSSSHGPSRSSQDFSGNSHTGDDNAVADLICDSGHLAEERCFFSQRGQAGHLA